jgi:hypothetical protein
MVNNLESTITQTGQTDFVGVHGNENQSGLCVQLV